MEFAIEMRNVTKQYHKFALDHIDFNVPKGCVVGLIGENGAGKTTLIKAILNLIKADSGEVLIQNRIMTEADCDIREEIGVVFDGTSFPEELKVRQLARVLSGIFRNWDEQKFHTYMETFHLPYDKKIKEFSRGMKMKLNIAAALSHHAKLLILDEATGGLDPVVRDDILDILLEFMQDEEHSILISSHIISDIEKIADHITFIREGKIIFTKDKDDLLYNYGILKCKESELGSFDPGHFLSVRRNAFHCEVLIDNRNGFIERYRDCIVDPASIEDIMLFYVKGDMV